MRLLPLLSFLIGVSGLRMMSENRFVPPALEERLR